MRIKFFSRLLAALTGIIVLFIGLCLLIFGLGIFPFKIDLSILEGPFVLWQRFAIVGVALVLCILGIHSILILFRRRRDKGFIMQHTEYGDMSISMHAMENMVKKCIDTHEELKVTHTRIHRTRDGVVVDIRVSLANGVNIPLTVNALQKQIKHYITSCSGVDVKEVRVMVETANHAPKSAEVIAPDLLAADASVSCAPGFNTPAEVPAQTEAVEPMHQRIFKHEEAPHIVPQPPVEEAPVAAAEAVAEEAITPAEAAVEETITEEAEGQTATESAAAQAAPEEAVLEEAPAFQLEESVSDALEEIDAFEQPADPYEKILVQSESEREDN